MILLLCVYIIVICKVDEITYNGKHNICHILLLFVLKSGLPPCDVLPNQILLFSEVGKGELEFLLCLFSSSVAGITFSFGGIRQVSSISIKLGRSF